MTIGRKRTPRRPVGRRTAPGEPLEGAISPDAPEIAADEMDVSEADAASDELEPIGLTSGGDKGEKPDADEADEADSPVVEARLPSDPDENDTERSESGFGGGPALAAAPAPASPPELPEAGPSLSASHSPEAGEPNVSGDEAPSLLARWKTPSWASDAGGRGASASQSPSLEPDSIPALLRLPPRPIEEELSPAREERMVPTPAPSSLPSTAAMSARDDETTVIGLERETLPEAGGSTGDIAGAWREHAARSREEMPGSAAESSEPVLVFHFRDKRSDAPSPEEAAEQNDWAAPRTGRIGNRSELPRSPQSRGHRPGQQAGGAAEMTSGGPRGRTEGSRDEPDDETPGAVQVERGAPVESADGGAEDAEGREDRASRRRRKDRRGRRPDRGGMRDGSEDELLEVDGATVGRYEEAESMRPSSPAPSEAPTPAVQLQDEEQIAELEALSRISLDQRLGKEIFVNTGTRETRIAYLVSGALTEIHLEREERLVGAICKARVDRVLPGMDAAFVDAGLERNAFLMAGDVVPDDDDDDAPPGRRPSRHLSISELLKPRQEIMVQITKAPHSTKGARVSTRISLPGRFLVLMPETETVGVSRKIDDDSERDRLKRIARSIRPSGFGVIVRTEAENKTEEELRSDVDFLVRLWGQIQTKYRAARAGSVVHRDLSLTFKVIRDLFGSDVNRFVIDSRDEYEKVMELVDFITPRMKSRVLLYEDPVPMFERIGIEEEIERLFRNKVWLKSGGTLLIDETEALTTIDVNSGKFVGTTNPSQTIFKINMEAVVEICRQIRLRDIGGMIILDFIDMSNARDRAAVMKALEVSLKKDRSRTKIAHLSPLGLVEMTRKRTGETFRELNTEPCSYCSGRGRTMNADTVSIQVDREIKKLSQEVDDEAFLVMVHPSVAPFLLGPEGANTDRLEREIRRGVYVRSTDNLHIEKFEVVPVDMQEVERQLLPYREGQVLDCIVEQSAAFNLPHAVARLDGYLLDLVNGGQYLGRKVRARLIRVGRSMAVAEVVGGGRTVDKLGGM